MYVLNVLKLISSLTCFLLKIFPRVLYVPIAYPLRRVISSSETFFSMIHHEFLM